MQNKKPTVLILVGPTASGKTALAIHLAQMYDGEVISADSRQVYRGLDIATGKVTKEEMRGIPHHLLDIASPRSVFNADDFVNHAQIAITDIISRGKLPIIAGGTGFYIDALTGRIALSRVPPDKALRTQLETKSVEELYKLLLKQNPQRAEIMNTPSERNNKVRLIRALEIAMDKNIETKNKAFIESKNLGKAFVFDYIWIGITVPVDELDSTIDKRVTSRLELGMIAEAENLHKKGLSYKRMTALGLEYRSLARYLQNKITKSELESEIARENKRYAKKQISYWKRNNEILWFSAHELIRVEDELRPSLEKK